MLKYLLKRRRKDLKNASEIVFLEKDNERRFSLNETLSVMKKVLLILMCGIALFVTGCRPRPVIKTYSPATENVTAEPTENTAETPTLTETEAKTTVPPLPFTPDDKTYGPFVFGEYQYLIRIESISPGSNIKLIKPDGTVVLDDVHGGMESIEKTLLTASIMDLNFDNIPDFSYSMSSDNKRYVWLADGSFDKNGDIVISSYTYCKELSIIPQITRCFELQTLYGIEWLGGEKTCAYRYKEGEKNIIVKGEEVAEVFEWNIDKIAYALAGPGAVAFTGDSVVLRGKECGTYIVGGYLTVAYDEYGNYYIKDLPQDGFYRLSLNPTGNWSKSEKISMGMEIVLFN